MTLKTIFKNDFDELRAGWQIAVFVLLFGALGAALVIPLVELLHIRSMFATSVASLLAVLLASLLATRLMNRKPLSAIGLAVNRSSLKHFGIGCLAGWLMMTGIFGVEWLLGYVKVDWPELTVGAGLRAAGVGLVFFGVAALFEEILFRGYLFQSLVRGITFGPATLLSAFAFGVAHMNNPNVSAFGITNTILVAILCCLAYWKTRGLWLPFGLHFAWNFSQTVLYGFPTSGKDFSNFELTKLTQFGDEWITGGGYGPEGGALATLAILACGAYIVLSRRLEPAEGTVTLERNGEVLSVPFLDRLTYQQTKGVAA